MSHFIKLAILLFCLTSCTTVRYRYVAELEIKKKDEYEFVFEKDYSTQMDAVICALSCVVLCPYCFLYLGKPDSNDIDKIDRDAEKKLRQLMIGLKHSKYDFEIKGSQVSRAGWGWTVEPTSHKLEKKFYD